MPRIGLDSIARPLPRRAFFVLFGVCARALADRHALRELRLEPGHAVLPAAGHHRRASSRSASRFWAGRHSRLRNSRRGLVSLMVIAIGAQAGPLGLLRSRVELSLQPGPVGPSDRPVGARRWVLYTFHDWPPDLAFFMKRPVRQLPSPTLSGIPAGPSEQVCLAARVGIRELAQVCPADHAGREIPRPIGRRTHPGSHRRPSPPAPGPESHVAAQRRRGRSADVQCTTDDNPLRLVHLQQVCSISLVDRPNDVAFARTFVCHDCQDIRRKLDVTSYAQSS